MVSPDTRTKKQIDQVYISGKLKKSFQDIKAMREADTAASDHHLIAANIKLKLKNKHENSAKTPKWYDVKKTKAEQQKQTERS